MRTSTKIETTTTNDRLIRDAKVQMAKLGLALSILESSDNDDHYLKVYTQSFTNGATTNTTRGNATYKGAKRGRKPGSKNKAKGADIPGTTQTPDTQITTRSQAQKNAWARRRAAQAQAQTQTQPTQPAA
jgi:hypothetical protein